MKLRERQKYLRYLRIARHWKGHGIHSPFMFHLQTEIIENKYHFYAFKQLRKWRKQLEESHRHIGELTISELMKQEVRPRGQAELLFRLVNHFQPSTILELGTSVGLTTLHLASASKSSQVITVEPCPDRALLAGTFFKKAKARNIELWNESYDKALTLLEEKGEKLDFILVDNALIKENYQSLISRILKLTHPRSVVVIGGLHVNKETEKHWKWVINNDQVRVSVGLFHLGLLFFYPELQRQHYTCRFRK